MTHDDAIRQLATERYLLGELAPEQREAFEEHYFCCQDCAMDLQAGAAFLQVAKEELQTFSQEIPAVETAEVRGPRWNFTDWLRPAWAFAALALLLFLSGSLNMVQRSRMQHALAHLEAPRILPNTTLIKSDARGAGIPVLHVNSGEPFLLYVDVPSDSRYDAYAAALSGPAGREEWSIRIPADATKDTLPIQSVAPRQGSGVYVLTIKGITAEGGTSQVIEQLPFELQIGK